MSIVIHIDGIKFLVDNTNNRTIFQICNELGKKIPHFCFNKKLAISGNCRICLVEIKGSPKPVVSCTTPIADGMVIFTKSPAILKARENIMEFLLINHPLDCPVCDQAGECDLQELSINEGSDQSRYNVLKRSVSNKIIDDNIETKMTRCIHCTKCVRLAFIIGVSTLGLSARGNKTEIFDYGYVKKNINKSKRLIGNIIDICPVGWC
jgi:NADH-quinone oxidoreductase subunit G